MFFVVYFAVLLSAMISTVYCRDTGKVIWLNSEFEALTGPTVPKPLDYRSYYQRDMDGNMIPLSNDSEMWLVELEKNSARRTEISQRLSELFFSSGAQRITFRPSVGHLYVWMSEADLRDLLEELPLSNIRQIRGYSMDEYQQDLSAYHEYLGRFFHGSVPSMPDSNGNFPSPRDVKYRLLSRLNDELSETKWEFSKDYDNPIVNRFHTRVMRRSRSLVYDSVVSEALKPLRNHFGGSRLPLRALKSSYI